MEMIDLLKLTHCLEVASWYRDNMDKNASFIVKFNYPSKSFLQNDAVIYEFYAHAIHPQPEPFKSLDEAVIYLDTLKNDLNAYLTI